MTKDKVDWSRERDFAALDMLQENYADKELADLGMSPEDIKEFRSWQAKGKE